MLQLNQINIVQSLIKTYAFSQYSIFPDYVVIINCYRCLLGCHDDFFEASEGDHPHMKDQFLWKYGTLRLAQGGKGRSGEAMTMQHDCR